MLNRSDLPSPDTLIDLGDLGCLALMFIFAAEGHRIDMIAGEQGYECKFMLMEDDVEDDDPVYVRYFDEGDPAAIKDWEPTPLTEGWQLGGKYSTEDGPCAVFIRKVMRPQDESEVPA